MSFPRLGPLQESCDNWTETENSSSVISFGAKSLYQKAFALTTFSQPETEFKQVLGGANVGGIID